MRNKLLNQRIERNLARISRLPLGGASSSRAAVVVAIVANPEVTEEPYFLLTRRASKLRDHAGQFALPGGKVDQGETIEQAALRELEEELGISVGKENIIGLLDDYSTRSDFCITPVVVWIGEDVTIKPNADEVARVFQIPLRELEAENLVNLDPGETQERPVFSINLATIGYEVYAPTAAIIYQFYEMALQGRETRVAHYDAPRFAWS